MVLYQTGSASLGLNLRRHQPKDNLNADIPNDELTTTFVRSVDFEGLAHRAGLVAGDIILSVNGQDCASMTHVAVRDLILQGGVHIELRVQYR